LTDADIMNIAGLAVVTISGVMLAFDPLYGAGNRFQLKNAEHQLTNMKSSREKIINDWYATPKWKDDPEYVEGEIKKLAEESKRNEDKLETKIANLGDKFEDRAVTLAAYGVILLVIGFALQLGGTLWMTL
jgi:hypothetical protein